MRQSLLPFAVRKPRLISSAVMLPLMSQLFATSIVALLNTLLCIFDSCKVALARTGPGRIRELELREGRLRRDREKRVVGDMLTAEDDRESPSRGVESAAADGGILSASGVG